MSRLYALPIHSIDRSILTLLALALLSMLTEARAQSSACDSCMSLREILAEWNHPEGAGKIFELRSGSGRALVDRVRRITRVTIFDGDRPRQGLHVWYGAGDRCRDTIIVASEQLLLRGGSIEIPILPAREFVCDDLLSTNTLFIGGGVLVTHAGADVEEPEIGSGEEGGFDQAVAGFRLYAGGPVGRDIELVLAGEVFTMHGRIRIPVSGQIRWRPFGGLRTESALHFVPSACQFMAPGDKGLEPPKRACSPAPSSTPGDSTVYVVEERTPVPIPFTPYFYGEGGFILNAGGFVAIEQGPSLNNRMPVRNLVGAGVGMPIISPLVITLGYRYSTLNSHAILFTLAAEFR